MPRPASSTRGTVSLVALCFVAVLGLVLASYLAVSTRSMTLSNRTFQGGVAQQLAEFGLEEGLRAFNKNDWSDWSSVPTGFTTSGAWSIDSTNKRASRTITLDSTKLGQGTSATIKIRIDNYDAAVVGAAWTSTASYKVGDLVGRSGTWYRCVKDNSNQAPSGMTTLANWVPEPAAWTWQPNVSYQQYDVVNYSGTWYRCTSGHTSPAAWTGANWATVPSITQYSSSSFYNNGDIVYYPSSTTWYRYSTSSGWLTTAGISWQYLSGATYSYNDVVYYYNGTSFAWYRFINATPTSGITPGSNAAYWENAYTGSMWAWSSAGIVYNVGDSVYYASNSRWYRCIRAHTSSGSILPTNTTYWATTPSYSGDWDSGRQYSSTTADLARYNGVWYRCLVSNTGSNPATSTSNWASAANSTYAWSAATAYSTGDYAAYGGVWYKCVSGNTGQPPNNATYWTPTWTNSWNVTTGAPVIYAEATVTIAGNPSSVVQLRGALQPAPLFPNAVGATDDLTITTGTGTVDSYDSSTGTYASQTGTATNYSAVLAAGGTLAINGTTAVNGYLAWPFGSTPSGISNGTTVKSLTSPSSPNLDVSRLSRTPFVPTFTPVGLSTTLSTIHKGTALPTPSTTGSTITIGTPGATTPSRYYVNGDLDLGSANPIATVNIDGPVVLFITNHLRTRSGGTLNVNAAGSAEIHVGGGLRTDSGSGGFVNRTLNAQNLVFIVHTNSTTTQLFAATANPFYGVIYAPDITSSTGYEVATGVDFTGALSASDVTFSSEANVHYDTALRYAPTPGVEQPYAVTQWRELPQAEKATMP